MRRQNRLSMWRKRRTTERIDQQIRTYSYWKKALMAGLIICSGISGIGGVNGPSGISAAVAAAATPKLDTIRVALFIDTGKYSSNTANATLSSESGLQLGLRGDGGLTPVYQATAGESVRVAAEGYPVIVLETTDASQAKTLGASLAAGGEEAGIVQRTKQGQPVYQVYLGPFATKAAAAAKAASRPGAAASGPLHWNAGAYASVDAARAQADAIAQAGFDADVAQLPAAAGAPAAYAAFVGAAADAAALEALKAQLAAALPAVTLAPVDPAQGYVLRRSELAVSADGAAAPVSAFAFGGSAASVKLWAQAAGDPLGSVTVRERYGRAYRGGMELSRLNGKLAVINELPFEQYLYSVVSSELSKDWPLEALKAQAVAARTYALKQGMKYQIAHVSDSTADQAYKGLKAEFVEAVQAVQATQGEVLADKNGLISPLFYSNAGGLTAEPTEVWGNNVPYLKSTPSPDDEAEAGKKVWYRIVLPNGNTGYIHSDYARDTGQKNPAGLPYFESTDSGVSVRSAPYVDNAGNPPLFKVDKGTRFVVIDQALESNAYSWIRGPYDQTKLKEKIGAALPASFSGNIERLEVSKRGASGRALEVSVNGQPLKAAYPDSLRGLLGGLPSTRFEIEETGSYTILGTGGTTTSETASSQPVYVISGNGAAQQVSAPMVVMNSSGKARPVSKTPQFIFRGKGLGHGLGMSQWGAKGYAELGYDYQKILQTYYNGVSITKG